MKYLFAKGIGCLKPAEEAAEDILRKIKHGENVQIEIKESDKISLTRHKLQRKFFAMVGVVHDNQEHYSSKEQVLSAMCIGVGHAEFFRGPDGITYAHRKSISYDETTDREFIDLYEKCIKFVAEEIIPGLEEKDLHEAVMELSAF